MLSESKPLGEDIKNYKRMQAIIFFLHKLNHQHGMFDYNY